MLRPALSFSPLLATDTAAAAAAVAVGVVDVIVGEVHRTGNVRRSFPSAARAIDIRSDRYAGVCRCMTPPRVVGLSEPHSAARSPGRSSSR